MELVYILVIKWSYSSEVERGLSQMILIKTNIKSKLSTKHLNNITTINMFLLLLLMNLIQFLQLNTGM